MFSNMLIIGSRDDIDKTCSRNAILEEGINQENQEYDNSLEDSVDHEDEELNVGMIFNYEDKVNKYVSNTIF